MKAKAGIDHFSLAQFEAVLPHHKLTGAPLCRNAGLVDGEYVFQLPVGGDDSKVVIEIRSSIGPDGMSADTGENSIRAYLIWYDRTADGGQGAWRPLGSKTQKYVTRVPGWPIRLTEMLRTLYQWRRDAGNCPECGLPKGIFKVKKAGLNHDRPYAKCLKHGHFIWLDVYQEATK